MSFECAVVHKDGNRCKGTEQGDTTYLGVLMFCVQHQAAFEAAVSGDVLKIEAHDARWRRTDLFKVLEEAARNPRPAPPKPNWSAMRNDATVYFIRCEGYVKIGYAIAPRKRLKQLQAMDGTKYPDGMNCATAAIIQTEPGGLDRERRLHLKFSHLRHTGEWFTEAPELTEYINNLSEVAA